MVMIPYSIFLRPFGSRERVTAIFIALFIIYWRWLLDRIIGYTPRSERVIYMRFGFIIYSS